MPKTIVVVLGGNTFHLTDALARVPSFRKLLIDQVEVGKVMYTGYSAGSMLAGKSIEHSRDERPVNPTLEGLGLVGDEMVNPHANDPSAKNRPGVKIDNGMALFFENG